METDFVTNHGAKSPTNILIVSGYLGAGKTTFIQNLILSNQFKQRKIGLIVNELGEFNLDGLILGTSQPSRTLLSGCVCCSIRGDFSLSLMEMIQEHAPELIIVETTGAANPMELYDAIAEVGLALPIGTIHCLILLDACTWRLDFPLGRKKLHRLLDQQLRCANWILLNHCDRITTEQAGDFYDLMKEIYPYARLQICSKANPIAIDSRGELQALTMETFFEHAFRTDLDFEKNHEQQMVESLHPRALRIHHTSVHVMVHSVSLTKPITQDGLEKMIQQLPKSVHRGKGLITLSDRGERALFQYAFQTYEIIPVIVNQDAVDVLVWIGEQMDGARLDQLHEQLLNP